MNILILSNFSKSITDLNALTEPNKKNYAKRHGYDFKNVKMDFKGENHITWLNTIKDELLNHDVVLTIGCDAIFTNLSIAIESRMVGSKVVMAREHLNWWPMNNDVAIWPSGYTSSEILTQLIKDSDIWLKYPWMWQNHLWNLMQENPRIRANIHLAEARSMNSTFQPFIPINDQAHRIPGPSSWQLGDWILHALDLPYEQRLRVIEWGLKFVGNGTHIP